MRDGGGGGYGSTNIHHNHNTSLQNIPCEKVPQRPMSMTPSITNNKKPTNPRTAGGTTTVIEHAGIFEMNQKYNQF